MFLPENLFGQSLVHIEHKQVHVHSFGQLQFCECQGESLTEEWQGKEAGLSNNWKGHIGYKETWASGTEELCPEFIFYGKR